MSIITEYPYITPDGNEDKTRVRTYSDEGLMILQLETGKEYGEAIDNYPSSFTYAEIIPDKFDEFDV